MDSFDNKRVRVYGIAGTSTVQVESFHYITVVTSEIFEEMDEMGLVVYFLVLSQFVMDSQMMRKK